MTEAPARVPGWTLLRSPDTKSVRYRAPDGSEVGSWAYNTVLKHWKTTGVVPQSPLGTKWRTASNQYVNKSSSKSPDIQEEFLELPIPGSDETLQVNLPEPHSSTASHKRSGLFTSKELSTGFQSTFVIVTSIMAMAIQLPEAQMQMLELKSISVPLGNIVERSKYNRTIGNLVVDKSDYLQLGYAMWLYIDRVSSAAKGRRNAKSSGNATAYQQSGPDPNIGTASGGSFNGVPLKAAPTGLRGYTGSY